MMYFWLIFGLIAIVIEWITPTALVSIWFGFAAWIAALVAWMHGNLLLQIIVFFIVSIVFIIGLRPFVKKYIHKQIVATNADRVIGATGYMTRAITPMQRGEVYVLSTYWSAVGNPVEKGKKVKILAIEGAKVVVEEIKEEDHV